MSINPAREAYVKYGLRRREQVIRYVTYVNQPSKRSLCQVRAAMARTSCKINRGLCQSTQQAKPLSSTAAKARTSYKISRGLCQSTQQAKPMSSSRTYVVVYVNQPSKRSLRQVRAAKAKTSLSDKSWPMSINPASEAYVNYVLRRREQVIR